MSRSISLFLGWLAAGRVRLDEESVLFFGGGPYGGLWHEFLPEICANRERRDMVRRLGVSGGGTTGIVFAAVGRIIDKTVRRFCGGGGAAPLFYPLLLLRSDCAVVPRGRMGLLRQRLTIRRGAAGRLDISGIGVWPDLATTHARLALSQIFWAHRRGTSPCGAPFWDLARDLSIAQSGCHCRLDIIFVAHDSSAGIAALWKFWQNQGLTNRGLH